ncbi:hypothetical protein PXO_01475 [Xanthomonas oryzae pv. oryzae PXO99A]|uniref:Uncharacterized protein n=1 Tax=Xanthomonas oryzae pv. oryzae (strain PXO99A) TaxID=360094 RepID=A0A0K0GMI3_XANOP|nr:hypothetical protein PXO_01475 [Xanthomonas oryzae pv. oryzae PXO99A]
MLASFAAAAGIFLAADLRIGFFAAADLRAVSTGSACTTESPGAAGTRTLIQVGA